MHALQACYDGTSLVANTAAATGNQTNNALWLSQSFVLPSGNTETDRVELNLQNNGTGADTVISLRADSSGSPATTDIVAITLPLEFLTTTARTVSVPLYATGLTASATYWIVVSGAGGAANNVRWNTNGGAPSPGGGAFKTSTTGAGSWSAVASTGGIMQVYAGTAGGVRNTIYDALAAPPRWEEYTYSSGLLQTLREYTLSVRSVRTLTYVSGVLTGVS